jgi:hypothetical protein
MLIYKVPREPSATRVYVWRKLKQLGAVAAQDAAWILPATPRTEEQIRWLAAEITELGGDAMVWKSELIYASDEPTLIRQFTEPLDTGYAEILKATKRKDANLAELSRRFQELQARDYFHSKLGRDVRQALVSLRGGKGK